MTTICHLRAIAAWRDRFGQKSIYGILPSLVTMLPLNRKTWLRVAVIEVGAKPFTRILPITTKPASNPAKLMPHFNVSRCVFAMIALLCCVTAWNNALGQSPYPSTDMAPTVFGSPFAVSGRVRKALPPIDCLKCTGPAACAPRNCCVKGFLYYGTYPWDDDCKNGFDECCNGECACNAVSRSLAWIKKREKCHSPFCLQR